MQVGACLGLCTACLCVRLSVCLSVRVLRSLFRLTRLSKRRHITAQMRRTLQQHNSIIAVYIVDLHPDRTFLQFLSLKIDQLHVFWKRRSTDVEALKLGNVPSGYVWKAHWNSSASRSDSWGGSSEDDWKKKRDSLIGEYSKYIF